MTIINIINFFLKKIKKKYDCNFIKIKYYNCDNKNYYICNCF